MEYITEGIKKSSETKNTSLLSKMPGNKKPGLTQKGTKVEVIHKLPLRKNQVFSHILRKS
ncbi:hypothetical protein H6F32_01770 [Anabaena sp. FACHB-1237]|uniref:hypothetical protein n=1 Tax=Anabaena sp. FACHB-1237 TaxID=2692769 RepID=UPI001680A5BB|nr:hypothetical protein [Anabaena sp. FACHB-1237]MBD2136339.1 hypothetical protein [Anabaena sp. FACHB-1237]